jgi:hypothetical protein
MNGGGRGLHSLFWLLFPLVVPQHNSTEILPAETRVALRNAYWISVMTRLLQIPTKFKFILLLQVLHIGSFKASEVGTIFSCSLFLEISFFVSIFAANIISVLEFSNIYIFYVEFADK